MSGTEQHQAMEVPAEVITTPQHGQGSPALMEAEGNVEFSIEELQARFDRMGIILEMREKFIQKYLKRGKDYGKVPGCGKKDIMLAPAAEKLREWYGLHIDVVLVRAIEDRENMYFEYLYRATAYKIGTTIKVGSPVERECNTREAAFGTANPYSIKDNARMKAQKRAFVACVRRTTATSDIFNEEDDPTEGTKVQSTPDDMVGTASTDVGDYRNLIKYSLPSKYGSAEKPNKCHFCQEFHIKAGDPIVGIIGPENKTIYGSEQCLAKDHAKKFPFGPTIDQQQLAKLVHQHLGASSPTEFIDWLVKFEPKYAGKQIAQIAKTDYERIVSAWNSRSGEAPAPEGKPEHSPSHASGLDALIAEIDALEAKIGGNPSANRQAKTGAADLSTRTETQLRNYLTWLKAQVTA